VRASWWRLRDPLHSQGCRVSFGAPGQPAAQIAVVVHPGQAFVPGRIRRGGQPHRVVGVSRLNLI
jgi:hypothetical protein